LGIFEKATGHRDQSGGRVGGFPQIGSKESNREYSTPKQTPFGF